MEAIEPSGLGHDLSDEIICDKCGLPMSGDRIYSDVCVDCSLLEGDDIEIRSR